MFSCSHSKAIYTKRLLLHLTIKFYIEFIIISALNSFKKVELAEIATIISVLHTDRGSISNGIPTWPMMQERKIRELILVCALGTPSTSTL